MDLFAQFGNTALVAVVGVLVWFYMRGQFEHNEKAHDEFREQVSELRRDADRKFELLMTELLAVRSDLTTIALAVRAQPRAGEA